MFDFEIDKSSHKAIQIREIVEKMEFQDGMVTMVCREVMDGMEPKANQDSLAKKVKTLGEFNQIIQRFPVNRNAQDIKSSLLIS